MATPRWAGSHIVGSPHGDRLPAILNQGFKLNSVLPLERLQVGRDVCQGCQPPVCINGFGEIKMSRTV